MKNLLIFIIIFLGLSCALNAQAGIIFKPVFNSGLVGYWNFDEGAGGNVYDKSGYGNHGTWIGTAGLVNESFEASGYDITSFWTEIVHSGCTVDEDYTAGSPPDGNQSLRSVKPAGAAGVLSAEISHDFGSDRPDYWITYYVKIISIADGSDFFISQGPDSSWNDGIDGVLQRSGSDYHLGVKIYNNGTTTPYVVHVSVGQWYKLSLKYDVTNHIAEWKLNDVVQNTITLTGTHATGVRYIYFGASTWDNTFDAEILMDKIQVSTTGWDQGYWANGKIGEAGSFNGINDYVEIADTSDLSFGNSSTDLPMTISAWIKMTDATEFKILDKGEYSSTIEYYFRLGDQGGETDNLIFRIYDASTGAALGREYSTVLTAYEGQWIHVAATYDGSATTAGIKLYLNGIRVDNTDYNYSSGYVAMENLSAAVWIARYTSYYSNGLIDEMRVYNRAFDSSEIQRVYKLSQPKVGINRLGPVADDNPSNAFIAYVREDCAGYSPCYTSLQAWNAAWGGIDYGVCDPGNLVCAEKSAVAKIDGPWTDADTTAPLIDSWVTDATHYIKIYTTASARHNGKWDDTKYRLSVSNPAWGAMYIRLTNYIWLDGLQISTSNLDGSGNEDVVQIWVSATSEHKFSNSIFKGGNSPAYYQGGIVSYATTLKIWNCLFYNFNTTNSNTRPIQSQGSTNSYIYNTTVIGGYYGILRNAGSIDCKNVYVGEQGAGGGYWIPVGTMTNCASSDATGSAGLQNIAVNTTNFKNITSGSEDFHIPPGSALKDAGANLSADAVIPSSTDIDRQNRTGNWDIGADESTGAVINASQNNQITNGLVGFWSFNGPDIDGNEAIDRSGQGNDGTITGATRTIGKVGQALSFDSGDYVSTPVDDQLDGINKLTISVWMKRDSTTDYLAVGRESDDFTDGVNIQFGTDGGSYVAFMPDNPGYARVVFNYTGWHHFVMVFDGTLSGDENKLKGYIDGVQRTLSFNASVPATTETMTVPFLIGPTNDGYLDEKGVIDEVRVYNRALTDQEILRLYNLGR